MHTILLVQESVEEHSKLWIESETVIGIVTQVISWYEDISRSKQPKKKDIKYTVKDLFNWIDSLNTLSCLTFNQHSEQYVPHTR